MRTQPAEDIDAVIGRFQAWAGSRTAPQPKPGIRELTYEEALESRRNRWRNPAKNSPRDESREQPRATRAGAPTAKSEPRHESTSEKRRGATRNASAKASARHHTSKTARSARPAPPPAKKTSAKLEANATPAPPAFRDALAKAIYPTEVVAAAQPSDSARQVAISIRLAPAERTLLRTRAAESGTTVSAYMRQCALEVEQLRTQVKQALAAMEQHAPAPDAAPEPPPAPRPGFLTRMMRRLLPTSTPRLALRA